LHGFSRVDRAHWRLLTWGGTCGRYHRPPRFAVRVFARAAAGEFNRLQRRKAAEIDFRRDGMVINASTPASAGRASSDKTRQMRGAVDQLTAYFLLEKQLTVRGTCALFVPVFDGSALYNLRSTDVKRETLSADDHQNFAGSSQVCEIVREDLVLNPDRNEDTYQRGKIWYARLIAGGQMMPVRMEFTTAFGVVKAYLAELRGRGVDVRLTPE